MMHNFINLTNVRLYIDPATTSYVIQIVAGIVIAIGAGAGIFWSKLKRALFKKKNASQNDPEMNMAKLSENDGKDVLKAEDLLDEDDD